MTKHLDAVTVEGWSKLSPLRRLLQRTAVLINVTDAGRACFLALGLEIFWFGVH